MLRIGRGLGSGLNGNSTLHVLRRRSPNLHISFRTRRRRAARALLRSVCARRPLVCAAASVLKRHGQVGFPAAGGGLLVLWHS